MLGHGLLSHNALVYVAFGMVLLVWFFLERTRPGLRLRAVGENPAMVEAAGMSVKALRYQALLMNGVLCGLAGAYLTLAQNASFSPNMTAGRGFVAIAMVTFGRWNPFLVFGAALLVGYVESLQYVLQNNQVPFQLLIALPYVLALLVLVVAGRGTLAPKALGQPFRREK